MVKPGFLKTITKNMSLKKIFIILGLISVIIVILFSLTNEYSLENFKPRSNAKIEVMLWTDPVGSVTNNFVKNEWLELVTKYEKYATFGYGGNSLSEYVTYMNGLTQLFGKPIEKKYTHADFSVLNGKFPFVTIVLEIDKVRDYVGYAIGGSLTTENIKNTLFLTINRFYRELYSDAWLHYISTSTSTAPAAVPTTQAGPTYEELKQMYPDKFKQYNDMYNSGKMPKNFKTPKSPEEQERFIESLLRTEHTLRTQEGAGPTQPTGPVAEAPWI
jgi:hypothetical protein